MATICRLPLSAKSDAIPPLAANSDCGDSANWPIGTLLPRINCYKTFLEALKYLFDQSQPDEEPNDVGETERLTRKGQCQGDATEHRIKSPVEVDLSRVLSVHRPISSDDSNRPAENPAQCSRYCMNKHLHLSSSLTSPAYAKAEDTPRAIIALSAMLARLEDRCTFGERVIRREDLAKH